MIFSYVVILKEITLINQKFEHKVLKIRIILVTCLNFTLIKIVFVQTTFEYH